MCEIKSKDGTLPLTLTAIGLAIGGVWELVATYINNILLMIIGVETLAGVAVITAGIVAFKKVHGRYPFRKMPATHARTNRPALPARTPLALPPGSSVRSAAEAAMSAYRKEFGR